MNSKEKAENSAEIVDVDVKSNQISIKNPTVTNESKSFTFDAVYDANTIQKNFYDESCFDLIENVLKGFNGTIFAYGQTGCGQYNKKTTI
jgi:kinesin family protein 3/17